MKKTFSSHSGFTLIEMMVTITIIISLFSLVFFPYGYYMERAYTERTIDTVGQEWILAHKEIRNGKIWSGTTNANTILIFRR
jgi:prepilin-type N-terminal cleavage/methylation domain-containing protein